MTNEMTNEQRVRQTLLPHVRLIHLNEATRRLADRFADDKIETGVAAWLADPVNKHFLKNAAVEALMAGLRGG
jgi:hypothetical protein